jgi:hypothetical protein
LTKFGAASKLFAREMGSILGGFFMAPKRALLARWFGRAPWALPRVAGGVLSLFAINFSFVSFFFFLKIKTEKIGSYCPTFLCL